MTVMTAGSNRQHPWRALEPFCCESVPVSVQGQSGATVGNMTELHRPARKKLAAEPAHSEGSTFRIYFLSPHNVICSREDAR